MADSEQRGFFQSGIFKSIANKLPYQSPNAQDLMKELNPKYDVFQDTGVRRTEALANQSAICIFI